MTVTVCSVTGESLPLGGMPRFYLCGMGMEMGSGFEVIFMRCGLHKRISEMHSGRLDSGPCLAEWAAGMGWHGMAWHGRVIEPGQGRALRGSAVDMRMT